MKKKTKKKQHLWEQCHLLQSSSHSQELGIWDPRLIQNNTSWVHNFLLTQITLNLKLDKFCKFKSSHQCTGNTFARPWPSFSQAKALKISRRCHKLCTPPPPKSCWLPIKNLEWWSHFEQAVDFLWNTCSFFFSIRCWGHIDPHTNRMYTVGVLIRRVTE